LKKGSSKGKSIAKKEPVGNSVDPAAYFSDSNTDDDFVTVLKKGSNKRKNIAKRWVAFEVVLC